MVVACKLVGADGTCSHPCRQFHVYVALAAAVAGCSVAIALSSRSVAPAPPQTSSWRTKAFELQHSPANCTIDRLNLSEWLRRFREDYHLRRPVLLRGWSTPEVSALRRRTERQSLLEDFGKITVFSALPSELVKHGQQIARTPEKLEDYVATMPGERYLFDDGSFMRTSGLDAEFSTIPGLKSLGTFNDWTTNATTNVMGVEVRGPALTFALGGAGQGVAFHIHGDSYNLQLHGQKKWAIYAPGNMTPTGFARSETFGYWLQRRHGGTDFMPPTWECLQEEGEALYIPEGFYHGTMSVGDSVGVVHQADRLIEGTAFHSFSRAFHARNTTEALQLLRHSIHLDRSNSDYQMQMGVAYASVGLWAEAADAFRAAVQLNPLNRDARINLVTALVRLGRRWEALATKIFR